MLGEHNSNHGMGSMSHLLRSQGSGLKTFHKSKVDAAHDTQGLQYGEMGSDRDISS